MCSLLACFLYSVMERRMRQSGVPISWSARRVLENPTGQEVARYLESLLVMAGPVHRYIALDLLFHPTFAAILKPSACPGPFSQHRRTDRNPSLGI